jgi:hypothetical protein
MIHDPTVLTRVPIEAGTRRVLYEERSGLVGDHVIDSIARRYAISLRLGGNSKPKTDYTLAKSMTRSAT